MTGVGATLASECGQVRDSNQDACCVLIAHAPFGPASMAVVCDGVGGLSHGELASAYVVNRMAEWFEGDLSNVLRSCRDHNWPHVVDTCWDEVLFAVHRNLRNYGESIQDLLATTFTGVLAYDGMYLASQIGDSRLYKLDATRLIQITEEQTLARRLVEQGELEADQVKRHPSNHVVLQAIGVGESLHPVYTTGTYNQDDLFILCSDGVYGSLTDTQICTRFEVTAEQGADSLKTACDQLIRAAERAQSNDNMSVVCMRGNPLQVCPETEVVTSMDTFVAGDDGLW